MGCNGAKEQQTPLSSPAFLLCTAVNEDGMAWPFSLEVPFCGLIAIAAQLQRFCGGVYKDHLHEQKLCPSHPFK